MSTADTVALLAPQFAGDAAIPSYIEIAVPQPVVDDVTIGQLSAALQREPADDVVDPVQFRARFGDQVHRRQLVEQSPQTPKRRLGRRGGYDRPV